MLVYTLMVFGCGDTEVLGLPVVLEEESVALDDSSEMGFSADQVIAFVGSRQYSAAIPLEYANTARSTRSELFVASAPFTLSSLSDPAAFIRTTGVGDDSGTTSLWIEGTIHILSDDEAFDTEGRVMLDATALSDNAVQWGSETALDGATGTMPDWVDDGVAERWEETGCSDMENSVAADDAFVWLVPHGPVGGPQLTVGATWEPPYADCGVTTVVAGVALSDGMVVGGSSSPAR